VYNAAYFDQSSLLYFCDTDVNAEIRLGIIGTDTSHVMRFAKLLNDPMSQASCPGAVIVAAYKGGAPIRIQRARWNGFAEELRDKMEGE